MEKTLEKIIGMDVKEAKSLLDEYEIDYLEETKKRISFKERTGIVIKTEIDNETGKVVIYESNRKLIFILMGLLGLFLLLFSLTFATGIYKSVKEQIIDIIGIDEIGAPVLETDDGWGKERIVKVVKDANSNKPISYYEYCVKKEEKNECNWEKTYTKNTKVGKTGKWIVIFRAVNEEGKKGKEASIVVYVDNESPNVEDFKIQKEDTKTITVKTEAKDSHSGIDKYMYSLDGINYIEGKEEYTFKELEASKEYTLYVKVIDKVGNEKIVNIKVIKKTEEELNNKKEKEWDIPKIDLNKVPTVFNYGEKFNLPSHYDFGNDTGVVVCTVGGLEVKDTSSLPVGRHTIICTATSSHGKQAQTSKTVLVQAPQGDDEILDGWIKLNLYYPVDSYNWEWRYGLLENDMDEEYEELGWQEYTGPILVKIEDIPKIYIRYMLDNEPVIVAPTGMAVVDIQPDNKKVSCGGSTQVSIIYDKDALTKQYRINGGVWQNYTGPFPVNGNTYIEAKVTKKEPVYDIDGDVEYYKLITNYHRIMVNEIACQTPVIENVAMNLNGLTGTIYLGESRSIPSYYTFGTHGVGVVNCVDDNNQRVVNTRFMSVGNHRVTCTLEAQDGTTVGPISKAFTILAREYDPDVSLQDVPSTIVVGDSYNLPSYYTYGSHGTGTVQCTTQGNPITNTNTLTVGMHEVTCEIVAQDGRRATAMKTVNVRIGFEPSIDLDDLSSTVYLGDFNYIPSHYSYGRPNFGVVTCEIDGQRMTDTHGLGLGTHYVACRIVNGAGQTASVSKTINVINRPITPVVPPQEVIDGPIITGNPNNNILTNETTVTITPQQDASVVKYSYDRITWHTYTGPIRTTRNLEIYAYYVRRSDGRDSRTSHYRVTNIRVPNMPHVVIDATPDYFQQNVNEVTVTITGTDCNYIEYSFDGILFQRYTGSITITNSLTVYARGVNDHGVGPVERLTITTRIPPVIPINLSIAMTSVPDGTQSYIVNEAEVVVSYDPRATTKVYKIGAGAWQNYTGPFIVNQNETVYAYSTCANGSSPVASLVIDFLTLGISDPQISGSALTNQRVYSEMIHINWDQNASVKKYKIEHLDGTDTGWLDYTGDFEVHENCKIYAYQEDVLGNVSNTVNYEVTNVIPVPVYVPIDLGDYYLLRLNYPSTSTQSAREYKWKEDGTWKSYDSRGILLIKQEVASQYNLNVDGLEIQDENGSKVRIPITHVYILDISLSEMSENLFIRWDKTKPPTPRINIDNEEPTTKVKVTITYSKKMIEKEYKLVYADGTESPWQPYTGTFEIDRNNTTVYARGMNSIEVYSDEANRIITNIDEIPPVIDVLGDLTTPKQRLNLTIQATDDKMLYMIKWARGRQTANYFNEEQEAQGTTIRNNTTVQINENGYYTFYATDQAGNETLKVVEVTNIDLTAPNIVITPLTSGLGTSGQVEIDYGDSSVKEYSIGDNSSWQTYTDTLTLSSYEHYQKKNQDGSLTIYARGKDIAENTQTISENIYFLDLDMLDAPVITSDVGYPTLTEDGISIRKNYTVTYDSRYNLTNDLSIDGGSTWYSSISAEDAFNKTLIARSRKASGMSIQAEKKITIPEDALGLNAYDNIASSKETILASTKKQIEVNISQTIKINVRTNGANGSTIIVYGTNGGVTQTIPVTSADIPINLAGGTTKIEFIAGNSAFEITEILIQGVVATIQGDSIIKIMQTNNLSTGYYNFVVNDQSYPVHLIEETNSTITTNKTYGDSGDVGTANSYAQNMVIVKRNGNLTINNGVTIAPYSTQYGGPKGFFLYVTGKLTNNGIIDNSHGAYAKGQDVYLWKNSNGTYEYVPAVGGVGGAAGWSGGPGRAGTAGTGRATGGGGTGSSVNYYTGNVGAGGTGTSYSGGTGGGGHRRDSGASNGSSEGGPGGLCSGGECYSGGRGAGNPRGGTGGLLIIYANEYTNNGTLTAKGTSVTDYNGGSSGGGTINVFTNQSTEINQLGVITDTQYDKILGEKNVSGGSTYGGAGGDGTVNIGEIRNGTYYDLKKIIEQDKEAYEASVAKTGDSILSIMQKNNLSTGYYTFVVNGEKYPVHLIEEKNSTINSNKIYGDSVDISDGTNYAQNMVIVKRTGDLTINSGVTIAPYSTQYGGPKGFFLYVTGKLTNNGTIDNSHGAYAKGQDVYLWKNSNGTYEYVPAVGGVGGAAGWSGGPGRAGTAGTGRATGGGGTGSSVNYYTGNVGAGGTGTSYSGGTGGGGHRRDSGASNGSSEGGPGGLCSGGECYSGGRGAGNPRGGTGGLLIIYANEYTNNGTLTAKGTSVTDYNGGSSGGGTINIFYKTKTSNGTTNVTGGSTYGGAGGNGTVTYTEISSNTSNYTNNLMSTQLRIVQNVMTANTIADTISQNVENPQVIVEKNDNKRIVSIEKHENYKTEYSLDLGNTWSEYNEPFEVLENKVIFTRIVDNDNKVLASSTFTITSIETVAEKETEDAKENEESTDEVLPSEPVKEENEDNNEEGDTNER